MHGSNLPQSSDMIKRVVYTCGSHKPLIFEKNKSRRVKIGKIFYQNSEQGLIGLRNRA